MERRVGEQQPDERAVGRHIRRQRTVLAPAHQHDGTFDRREEALLRIGKRTNEVGFTEVAHHDGERLGIAPLADPQPLDDLGRGRIAREMESPQALEGNHTSEPQCGRNRNDGILALPHRPLRRHQHQRRSAGGARVGLCMKAPILDPLVLLLAGRAHRERGHRRPGSVVRRVAGDREPRPAVRAVGERISVPPIQRIENLLQARGARGQVWRDGDPTVGRLPALDDRERVEPLRRDRLRVNLANLGGSRRGSGESVDEIVECFRRSERVNRHARGVVADAPGHAFLGGKRGRPRDGSRPLAPPRESRCGVRVSSPCFSERQHVGRQVPHILIAEVPP